MGGTGECLIQILNVNVPNHRHKDHFHNNRDVGQYKLLEILFGGFTCHTSEEYRRYTLKHCKLKGAYKQLDKHYEDEY